MPLRVNRAADDAAGLSVREGMRAEISGLKMDVLNAEQGTNLLQVAEGRTRSTPCSSACARWRCSRPPARSTT